ncbi:MAG TPA: anhydro-N-acetylmuramic acid kinase [Gemmatimonadota bacterium]|nr:anhydro-N-acetylmuramic acid kinase [Gemmatimonadota bacterium]
MTAAPLENGPSTPLERLAASLRTRKGVVVLGLMSGTSADGVDAACCRLSGRGRSLRCDVLGTAAWAYPDSVAAQLRRPEDLDAPGVARLSVLVGAAFADAARAAIEAAGLKRADVALVGSHGQTIWHDPRGARGGVGCTLQIGEAAEIAERTGLPVWHDFRPADVAAGGEGAPLVPYADWVLFTLADRWTVCLNLGGIANVTLLPPAAGITDVVAFDTGPGNMALDHLAARLLGQAHDEGGEAAAAGEVEEARLAAALADPYFALPAPKSTGREHFGRAWTEERFGPLEGLSHGEARGRLATAAAVTVESVAGALEGQAGTPPVPEGARVLVSGGGRRNRALMEGLARRLAPRAVLPVDEAGLDGDHKEAVAFAILAYESALGGAVAMPGATGARHPARLGKLALPPPLDGA